jgi:hypothetical protein
MKFLNLDSNWLGICPTSIPQLYSTVNLDTSIDSNRVIGFKNKDKNGYDYAFIGLSGVYDFETFFTLVLSLSLLVISFKVFKKNLKKVYYGIS